MGKGQSTGSKKRAYWAKMLVVLGAALALADLAFLAHPLTRLVDAVIGGRLSGLVPLLGLYFMTAVRALVLQQIDYVSLVPRILVLFSALVAIVIGVARWKARPAIRSGSDGGSVVDSLRGER
jgi:hypothetical protein